VTGFLAAERDRGITAVGALVPTGLVGTGNEHGGTETGGSTTQAFRGLIVAGIMETTGWGIDAGGRGTVIKNGEIFDGIRTSA